MHHKGIASPLTRNGIEIKRWGMRCKSRNLFVADSSMGLKSKRRSVVVHLNQGHRFVLETGNYRDKARSDRTALVAMRSASSFKATPSFQ